MRFLEEREKFSGYEEFRKWTEDKKGYWQLVGGVPMQSPSPTPYHQNIVKRLWNILYMKVEKEGKGVVFFAPCDVVLKHDTVYQPDIFVLLGEEGKKKVKKTHVEGAPDIVCEVLSPSTAHLDLVRKKYDYADAGVKEYWIIDPSTQTFEILSNISGVFQVISTARGRGKVRSELLQIEIETTDIF